MTEYLVRRQGEWHICHPDCTTDDTRECNECDGAGNRHGHEHTKYHYTCTACNGTGRVPEPDPAEREHVLCWVERDGAIFAFAWDKSVQVKELPE